MRPSAHAPYSERMAGIEFDSVSFGHSRRQAILDRFTLTVGAGETVALVGASGAGKTTVLKLVNRLLLPDIGAVRVLGTDTRAWDPIRLRRSVGYVIQEVGLFPHLTAGDNIAVVPRLEGWDGPRVAARVRELLELIGLEADGYSTRWPDELSGGQRQRVGVARALAADPPLLLMDEPFGALDPITRRQLQDEFRRIQAQLRKTVLLVTHDMAEAMALADRIGVLDAGRLIWCGPAADILASNDPRVREFVEAVTLVGGARATRSARPKPRLHIGRARPRDAVVQFWLAHRQELATLVGEHVLLVALSTTIAVAIGVPLGVFAARRPRLASPLVGIANIVQTVPSLAMFGFLLPVPLIGGIGARAALAVLILYGLLPIVRSTIVGITGIDRVDPRGRRRDGYDAARAAAAGRAAAGAALDRCRHPRGRGRRRRLGDDRRGDRRRRAGPVHLSRIVDGGHDGDPCRRDSGGAPGAHRRWRPAVARAAAVPAAAHGLASRSALDRRVARRARARRQRA